MSGTVIVNSPFDKLRTSGLLNNLLILGGRYDDATKKAEIIGYEGG